VACVRCLRTACCAIALSATLGACREEPPRPRRQDPSVPNPVTYGFIDIPAPNAVGGPVIQVSGWAADESGVEWIRLYADGQVIEHITLTIPRPDVEQEFPQFTKPGALHGWHATIDFGDQVGYRTIRAEALDGRGALTRFAAVTVKILP
jgi:hypothetical protein